MAGCICGMAETPGTACANPFCSQASSCSERGGTLNSRPVFRDLAK